MSKNSDPGETRTEGERIAKRIARAGLASRRQAEDMIRAGLVTLNGEKLTDPARNVSAADLITVKGQPLPAKAAVRLWRFHKPRGTLTSERDPNSRITIYDVLPKDLPRVVTVGRLDLMTEGLLLLTNDGDLKRRLELPANQWVRAYKVRVRGKPNPERLAALKDGLTLDGVNYGPIEARLEKQSGVTAWLSIKLKEGKNREIRRICEHLGLTVARLIRVGFGPFDLGGLQSGALAEVPPARLHVELGVGEAPAKKYGTGFAKAKPRPKRPTKRRKPPRDKEKDADRRG